MPEGFTHVDLPHIGKRVLRLGVAGNYGLESADIRYAVDRGVGLWVWSPRFKRVTPVLREVLPKERDRHVVAVFGMVYTAGMVRRGVENALRILGIEQLDIYLLGWLGRGSRLSPKIQDALVALQHEGKILAVGTSIHDRQRAGELAKESILDAFMLRYNAKHPGAEQDVFPFLGARDPVVISYTATSWRQLLRPIKGIEMPPWPGNSAGDRTPPPLTPELCYRFCLSSPHVHVTLTGPRNRAQLDENLAALDAGALSADEDAWVREYGRNVKAHKRLPYI
jgi:aryl-alcohol dehydrogenase-like predicted oxidoreductase